MQSIKQIMKDLGWDEDHVNEATARAYIKNLLQAASETTKPVALKPKPWAPQKPNHLEKQLSFDLDSVGSLSDANKKTS